MCPKMNYAEFMRIAVLLLLGSGMPATSRSTDVDAPASAEPALWFPVGEQIEYTIYWGHVPVGRSTATSEWVEDGGRRLVAIRFRTKSNKALSALYPVDDFIESLVDPDTFLPVQFTKKLSEGRYRCHEVTRFDHQTGTAKFENKLSNTSKEYEIDPGTRDLISFMYSMRVEEFAVGSTRKFRVMADEKLYDLTVNALKQEKVKLPDMGKVSSVVLEPEAAFQGLFVRKGKMTLWVSQDDRRIITKASIKVPVAHVNLVLERVSGPGDDRWVRPQEEEISDRPRPGRASRR